MAKFVRMTITRHQDGGEPCIDELEVYAADRNVALASRPGAKPTSSSNLARLRDSQARTLQRRPARQRPKLDLERTGARLGAARTGRAGFDRPRRLGPRPRREVSRSARHAVRAWKWRKSRESGEPVASSVDRQPFGANAEDTIELRLKDVAPANYAELRGAADLRETDGSRERVGHRSDRRGRWRMRAASRNRAQRTGSTAATPARSARR